MGENNEVTKKVGRDPYREYKDYQENRDRAFLSKSILNSSDPDKIIMAVLLILNSIALITFGALDTFVPEVQSFSGLLLMMLFLLSGGFVYFAIKNELEKRAERKELAKQIERFDKKYCPVF